MVFHHAQMAAAPLAQGDYQVLAWTLGACALGCVLYPLLQLVRRRKWVPFEGCVHEFKVGPGAGGSRACDRRQLWQSAGRAVARGSIGDGSGAPERASCSDSGLRAQHSW